ncbi:hypothetical protein J1N35_018613, partial [Gossypium stocksii]
SFQVDNYLISKIFIIVEGKWIVEGMEATLINVYAAMWSQIKNIMEGSSSLKEIVS